MSKKLENSKLKELEKIKDFTKWKEMEICNSIEDNPVPFWRRGAVRLEWISLEHGMGNVIFHIFDWYCDV